MAFYRHTLSGLRSVARGICIASAGFLDGVSLSSDDLCAAAGGSSGSVSEKAAVRLSKAGAGFLVECNGALGVHLGRAVDTA